MKVKAFFLASVFLFFSLNGLSGKTVQVITFNDFHGSMTQKGSNPGMAKFTTAVKEQSSEYPDSTIVVSGGDNYQGTVLSILTYGAPVNKMMKELHVAVSAVGNHEFDWGIDKIPKWSRNGGFEFLAANIVNKNTGRPVKWAAPYKIIKKDNARIAFIGLTTLESAFKTSKKNVRNLKFIDPAASLQKWVDYLRSGKAAEGKPNAIIAVTHIASYQNTKNGKITGRSITEICSKVKGIDAVITAHSHKPVSGYLNGIPVIQAYKYGRELGILKIQLDNNNRLEQIIPHLVSVTDKISNLKNDPEAEKIYKKYDTELKKFDKNIAVAQNKIIHDNHYKGVSPLGRLVCKILTDKTDSKIAVINGGGLRTGLNKGKVTISEIYKLMPFDNYVVTLKLKGRDLKRVIEHGLFNPDPDTGDAQFYGIQVYYNSHAPYMRRIESMTLLDGTPIKMDKYYKVATVDFMLEGGDQYDFSGAKDVHNTYTTLRKMLISGIKQLKTIKAIPVNYLINTAKKQKKAA
ncbi:MAG: 5'-nucleotidase C-terminal domain-containing protein [Victivallales bacterium]|nr:5'-nucleotidase C-terminal domain-containing protein [Victivallales bacterium]MCF7888709.1 5'-nucleotidase C-terminal domain-containing protein [Victivallales bacterium]